MSCESRQEITSTADTRLSPCDDVTNFLEGSTEPPETPLDPPLRLTSADAEKAMALLFTIEATHSVL